MAFIVGIDVDGASIRSAVDTPAPARNASFLIATATSLPFANACFDVAICNHIYEHVSNAKIMMAEIRRVMRPGAVCYFAAGHTLQLIEPHHRLPFLSWLPRRVADTWMRLAGRGERYAEKFLPPWRLRSLFRGFAEARLVSPVMLREPQRYGFPAIAQLPAGLRLMVGKIAFPLALLAPTWIWLLRR